MAGQLPPLRASPHAPPFPAPPCPLRSRWLHLQLVCAVCGAVPWGGVPDRCELAGAACMHSLEGSRVTRSRPHALGMRTCTHRGPPTCPPSHTPQNWKTYIGVGCGAAAAGILFRRLIRWCPQVRHEGQLLFGLLLGTQCGSWEHCARWRHASAPGCLQHAPRTAACRSGLRSAGSPCCPTGSCLWCGKQLR